MPAIRPVGSIVSPVGSEPALKVTVAPDPDIWSCFEYTPAVAEAGGTL